MLKKLTLKGVNELSLFYLCGININNCKKSENFNATTKILFHLEDALLIKSPTQKQII
jgi:hypothetical protein